MNENAENALWVFRKLVKKSRPSKYGSQFAPWLVQPGDDAPWEAVEQPTFEHYFRKEFHKEFKPALDELVRRGRLVRGTAEELFPNTYWGNPAKLVVCSPRFAAWLRDGRKEVWETAW